MTPAELAKFVETKRQAQQLRSRNRRFAEALTVLAHIPRHEARLVAILGMPEDRTNLDAMTRWVERNLRGIHEADFDPLDYLYARLEQILGSL